MITDAHYSASVVSSELNELEEPWNTYRTLVIPEKVRSFDLLTALRPCGAVVHAVPRVLDTTEFTPGNE